MPLKIVVFGNAGSGKTTLARDLARKHSLAHLDLDDIAWAETLVRREHPVAVALLDAFTQEHERWVVEGCYGDLIEHVAASANDMHFLDPGIEACIANCRRRSFEPSKFDSKEAQDAMLEQLIAWVREYETRDDEFSRSRHVSIFQSFQGTKTVRS